MLLLVSALIDVFAVASEFLKKLEEKKWPQRSRLRCELPELRAADLYIFWCRSSDLYMSFSPPRLHDLYTAVGPSPSALAQTL